MAMLEATPTTALTILKRNAMANIFTMMKGSPSTAKSSIAKIFAKQWNLYFIDIRLAQADPTDLNGFPKFYVNEESGRDTATYVPFDTFPIEGDAIPEGYAGWFIFFDELNSGDRGVAKAAYKIILDREVGPHKLHKNVVMAGAGNLDTDGALVEEQGTALQSRMCNIIMAIDRLGFRTFAEEQEFDRRITSFLHWKPEMAYAFNPDTAGNEENYPCYRTWEFTHKLLKVIPEEEFGDHATLISVAGNLGEGCARDFIAFCKLEDKLPKIEAILKDPENVKMPQETGQLWALTGAVASHMTAKTVEQLLKYVKRMGVEFQIITLRNACRKDRTLLSTPALTSWIAESGEALF